MKHNAYSIFDQASGLYSRPFNDQADAQAVRAFTDIACDASHPIGQHPEDYTLYRIATFDDATGDYNNEHNEKLITGLEAVSKSRNVDAARLQQLDNAQSELAKMQNGSDPYNNTQSPGGTA